MWAASGAGSLRVTLMGDQWLSEIDGSERTSDPGMGRICASRKRAIRKARA